MIIYCITNKVNGKQYVGQTVRSAEERFKEHCRDKKMYISKAIRKYGKENFIVETIDSALLIDDLNEKEIYWIDKFKTKNLTGIIYAMAEIIRSVLTIDLNLKY